MLQPSQAFSPLMQRARLLCNAPALSLTSRCRERYFFARYCAMGIKLRQHVFTHQPQRFHDIAMRYLARLFEHDYLVKTGLFEFLEFAAYLVGITHNNHVMLLELRIRYILR